MITRFFHFQNFELILATDSLDYLNAAENLSLSNQNGSNLTRSFLYIAVLKLFSQNLLLLVYLQMVLTLLSAFLMFKTLLARNASKKLAFPLVLIYLFYPMTAHFEGQILTENVSTILLLLFFTLWENSIKLRSNRSLLFATLAALALVLHRPNYIVFVAVIVLVDWQQQRRYLREFKSLIIIPLSFSTVLALSFVTTGNFQVGGNLVRTGIAMHLVDTFATDKENSAISREVDLSENVLKAENPSNRHWAIQNGFEKYLRSNSLTTDADGELWNRTKVLLREYPLIFAQSVNNSFFSVLVTDSGAFRPGGAFRDLPSKVSSILGLLILGPAIFFGVWLYLLNVVTGRFINTKKQTQNDLACLIAILGVSFVNAIVSPIEQGRYIHPFLPIILILSSRFITSLSTKVRGPDVQSES
jgi:hypothetical protein